MTTLIVIPCSGAKATERRTAEAMYLGSLHRAARAAAERRLVDLWSHGIDARIVTLSAKHGLLEDGDVIEPYDQELDKPGQVTPERVAHQLTAKRARRVIALTPSRYTRLLHEAILHTYGCRLEAPLDGAAGIGEIRHRLAAMGRAA